MAAPDFVPSSRADQARTTLPLPPARSWTASRPADLQRGQPTGPQMGRPGPDQGYVLILIEHFAGRIRRAEGEEIHDVEAGCSALALRRASMFGRAPVVHDLELACGLFGFLDGAPVPPELVEWRGPVFAGVAHDYWRQRSLVDMVPDSTLRLTPAQVLGRLREWRPLVGADQGSSGRPLRSRPSNS